MDKQFLLDQLDYVQARIEEIDEQVINNNPTEKGYKELIDSYNKWVDRYDALLEKIEHFDDEDLEKRKLDIESDKNTVLYDVESRKIELDRERLLFEKEKFQHEIQTQKIEKTTDIIFRSGDLLVRGMVPLIGLAGVIYVANLAYMNDEQLKLCNGRIAGGVKDALKIMTMKV